MVHGQPAREALRSVRDLSYNLWRYYSICSVLGFAARRAFTVDRSVWKIAYDKPLIVSEFGGDAKYGLHGDPETRWTEEYQANLYRRQLVMLNGIRQLRCMSPRILMDFRSPRRPMPGIQDYFNRGA